MKWVCIILLALESCSLSLRIQICEERISRLEALDIY